MFTTVNAVFLGLLGLFAKGYHSGMYGSPSPSFVLQTPDHGFAMRTGVYNSKGEFDGAIARLDEDGDLVWFKRYGWDVDHEYFHTIAQVSDGFVLGGYTRSFGGDMQLFMLKTDFNGNLTWARTYPAFDGSIEKVIPSSDGGLFAVGYTYSYGAGASDVIMIKMNSDGTVVWAKTWGGSESGGDRAYDCIEVSDGYVITGYYNYFHADVFLLKVSTSGSFMWAYTYNSQDDDYDIPHALAVVSDGFVIAGQKDKFSDADALVIKTDLDGNLVWAKTYGGDDEDVFYSVVAVAGGDLLLGGYTESINPPANRDFFFIKTSSTGDLYWAKTYDSGNDEIYEVLPISDGFALGGAISSTNSIMTLDANGDYPDCVVICATDINVLSMTSASRGTFGNISSFNSTSRTPDVADYSPTQIEFCSPAFSEETEAIANSEPAVSWSLVPGGAIFSVEKEITLSLFLVNGSRLFVRKLRPGDNLVSLKQGVYMWQAGSQRGKLVVR